MLRNMVNVSMELAFAREVSTAGIVAWMPVLPIVMVMVSVKTLLRTIKPPIMSKFCFKFLFMFFNSIVNCKDQKIQD